MVCDIWKQWWMESDIVHDFLICWIGWETIILAHAISDGFFEQTSTTEHLPVWWTHINWTATLMHVHSNSFVPCVPCAWSQTYGHGQRHVHRHWRCDIVHVLLICLNAWETSMLAQVITNENDNNKEHLFCTHKQTNYQQLCCMYIKVGTLRAMCMITNIRSWTKTCSHGL